MNEQDFIWSVSCVSDQKTWRVPLKENSEMAKQLPDRQPSNPQSGNNTSLYWSQQKKRHQKNP